MLLTITFGRIYPMTNGLSLFPKIETEEGIAYIAREEARKYVMEQP